MMMTTNDERKRKIWHNKQIQQTNHEQNWGENSFSMPNLNVEVKFLITDLLCRNRLQVAIEGHDNVFFLQKVMPEI